MLTLVQLLGDYVGLCPKAQEEALSAVKWEVSSSRTGYYTLEPLEKALFGLMMGMIRPNRPSWSGLRG